MAGHIPYLYRHKTKTGWTWHWKPSPELRAAGYRNAALGRDKDAAVQAALALNAQVRQATHPPTRTRLYRVSDLIADYQAAPAWTGLAPKTRIGYAAELERLRRFSTIADGPERGQTVPVQALTRGLLLAEYDRLAAATPMAAKAWVRVCRLLFAWAIDREKVTGWSNPLAKAGIGGSARRDQIWRIDQVRAILDLARAEAPGLALAILLGFWTSQREGDILALTWTQLGAHRLALTQQKTAVQVGMKLAASLADELAAARAVNADRAVPSVHVVTSARGQRYQARWFAAKFRALARAAGIPDGLEFRDLRRTCVVELARAHATIPQIAAITGHSITYCQDVLEHYLPRQEDMADAGIALLEERIGRL